MNAGQLIQALSKVDPETIIYWVEWDLEYDIVSIVPISGVCENGELSADYRVEHPERDRIEEEVRG